MKYLSKSQINMYQRCPYQYFCRYVEGLKMPPSSVMLMGSSLDTAVNYNYSEKIKTGNDEPVSIVTDCFAEYYDKEKDNTIFDDGENKEGMKDMGVKTTKVFHKELCSQVQPTEVQIKGNLEFSNVDYGLSVVIDVIEDNEIIIDNKYTGRTWQVGKEYQELDAVIYSLWFDQIRNKKSKCFRFDIGIGGINPKTERRERIIKDDEKMGFLKYLAIVNDSIENDKERGLFLPRKDHFLCSRKKCGYWQMCEREWKHRIKD